MSQVRTNIQTHAPTGGPLHKAHHSTQETQKSKRHGRFHPSLMEGKDTSHSQNISLHRGHPRQQRGTHTHTHTHWTQDFNTHCLLATATEHMDRLERHTNTQTLPLQQPMTINTNHFTFSPSYKSALSDCVDYTEYV